MDPGLKSLGQLGADIRLPEQTDGDGKLQPSPQMVAPAAPPPTPFRRGSAGGLYAPWTSPPYGYPLNFCYRPLYFEEVNLERYGHSWGVLQPVVSGVRFFGNFLLLPAHMAVQRPGFCTYHVHPYLPGGPAPRERPPASGRCRCR